MTINPEGLCPVRGCGVIIQPGTLMCSTCFQSLSIVEQQTLRRIKKKWDGGDVGPKPKGGSEFHKGTFAGPDRVDVKDYLHD